MQKKAANVQKRAKANKLTMAHRTKLLMFLLSMEPVEVRNNTELANLLTERLQFVVLPDHIKSIRQYSPEALANVTFKRANENESSAAQLDSLQKRITELEISELSSRRRFQAAESRISDLEAILKSLEVIVQEAVNKAIS